MLTDLASGRRLDSWKDIAAYLGRDVRTAIRWEKDKGLPVRRVPGGLRKAVFAYTTELDAWLTRESEGDRLGLRPTALGDGDGPAEALSFPSVAPFQKSVPFPTSIFSTRSPKLRYFALAGVVAVGVLLLALFGLRSRGSQTTLPVRVDFTLNTVQAFDDRGLLLWTHEFPGKLWPSTVGQDQPLSHLSYIADFRGKGDQEVLVIAAHRTDLNPDGPVLTEVDLFSSRGQLLWSYVPYGRFEFGKHNLTGPWAVLDLFVSSRDGRKQIWAAVGDQVWGNSFVVSLDPTTGKDTVRFVNTGAIRALNELTTPHGTFLIAGGFNNESDTGSLAVIDEAKPFAASPQSEGTRHKCVNCPPGDPDYYFVFPRSEINELEQFHEDGVYVVRVTDDQIEVRKRELAPTSGAQTFYLLREDRGLRLRSVRFDSVYDMLHRKLELEGKIGHSLEQCPERLHPRPIRMWTPAEGWTEIRLDTSRASE